MIYELDGRPMWIEQEGKGTPVLFLHGITTYSFIWRKIAPLLIRDFEVIIPDLMGCGNSSKDISISYSLSAHADRIAHMLRQLGKAPVHLVGHDLGGGISQILAVRYPELFRSMTLINTVAYDFWPVQPIIAMRTPVIRQLIMATLDFGTFRLIVERGIYHKERVTQELMDLFNMPMATPQGRKAFLHFAHCLDNQDLMSISEPLSKLKLPTQILRGDGDVYLTATIAEKLVQNIPNAVLHRISTAGHFIQEDEPEWVVQNLRDFWKVHT